MPYFRRLVVWGDRKWGREGSSILGSGWRVIFFRGLVEGQCSSVSGSGRSVSFLYGKPRCVGAGGGARPSNFGKLAAGLIYFSMPVLWGDRW